VYTTDDIIYPQNLNDYDCDKGHAEIPSNTISMTPLPYNANQNDAILSGKDSLCYKNSPDSLANCPSQSCLLTGTNTSSGDMLKACCAWDLHVWLYNDPTLSDDEPVVTIPAVYLTMQQGNFLLDQLKNGSVNAILYERYRPAYNPSAILIWGLGVFVAALAAYLSAGEYISARKQVERHAQMIASPPRGEEGRMASLDHAQMAYQRAPPVEETLELAVEHAFGFIVMASTGLFILFFFKIYNVVKVMYAIGCSKAVSQVIFFPLLAKLARRFRIRDKIVWQTGTEDFGDISQFDIIAGILGFGLGLAWLVVAFTVRHPENFTFFWITQDVMGSCMCIMFLSIIKLNCIRVASILLIIAFAYDIFMVFITPLIFNGESVMITVATSGGPPKADPSWCEKYPDDVDCQGGDPLPMLLTVPRIGDYQGGASLLGLGDIVLPGLLLSFAARLDAAKRLLGVISGGSGANAAYTCREDRCGGAFTICNGGYFAPLVIAYAVGLLMANTAVYVMQMGQPALLYLVPCCLGTICYMGWRRNELLDLWNGPKVIRTADTLLYGEGGHDDPGLSELPTEEGLEAPAAPSAQDEQVDEAIMSSP
jgi:signal peptide peptidase-like protein 2B